MNNENKEKKIKLLVDLLTIPSIDDRMNDTPIPKLISKNTEGLGAK